MADWAGARSMRWAPLGGGGAGGGGRPVRRGRPAVANVQTCCPGGGPAQATGAGGACGERLRPPGNSPGTVRDETAALARPSGVTWPRAGSGTARLTAPAATPSRGRAPLSTRLFEVPAARPSGRQERWSGRSRRTSRPGAAGQVAVRVLGHPAATAAGVKGMLFSATAASVGRSVRLGVDFQLASPTCTAATTGLAWASWGLPGLRADHTEGGSLPQADAAAVGRGDRRRPGWCRHRCPCPCGGSNAGGTAARAEPPAWHGGAGGHQHDQPGGRPGGTYGATTLKPSGSWTAGGVSRVVHLRLPDHRAAGGLVAGPGRVPVLRLRQRGRADRGDPGAGRPGLGDGWSTPETRSSSSPSSRAPTARRASRRRSPPPGQVLRRPGPDPVAERQLHRAGARHSAARPRAAADDNGAGRHACDRLGQRNRDLQHRLLDGHRARRHHVLLRAQRAAGLGLGRRGDELGGLEPVYSRALGRPVLHSCGFTSSVCTMAYRWNLDYVTDVHGNAMAYYYDQATNSYGEDGTPPGDVSYVRDSLPGPHRLRVHRRQRLRHRARTRWCSPPATGASPGTCDPLNSTNAGELAGRAVST